MREAIIQLNDDDLEAIGLADVVDAARDAGLRAVRELVCHGSGGIVQFQVTEPIPSDAFNQFDSVVWWEALTGSDSGVTYLCKIEPPDQSNEQTPTNQSIAHNVADGHEGQIHLSVVSSQDEIGQSITTTDASEIDPQLQCLTDFECSTTATVDSLTERQREIVETAHAMGYYEVPRLASTEEVAAEVKLDSSTVAEHLQRAEHNLIEDIFETTDTN